MVTYKNKKSAIVKLTKISHNIQLRKISKTLSFKGQYSCSKVDYKNVRKFLNKWNSIIQLNFNQRMKS